MRIAKKRRSAKRAAKWLRVRKRNKRNKSNKNKKNKAERLWDSTRWTMKP